MKHIKTFTVATATLLLLTMQSVHAETAQETTTGDTTAEVQLSKTSSNDTPSQSGCEPSGKKKFPKSLKKLLKLLNKHVLVQNVKL